MALQALVLPFTIIAFCTWVVYLGGLASMQAICTTTPSDFGTADLGSGWGFNAYAPCHSVFSYWWFVMSMEFFTIIFTIIIATTPSMLITWRNAALGLFVICTILYIEASNSWYSLQQSSNYYGYTPQLHKVRTTVAGAIMTATVNGILVILLGMREGEMYETKEVVTVVKEPVATYNTAPATAV